MQMPNNIIINVKSYDPQTTSLIITYSTDDGFESNPITYQMSSFSNNNIDYIMKTIAYSAKVNIERKVQQEIISSNAELTGLFANIVNTSFTFETSMFEPLYLNSPNTDSEVVI